MTKQVKIGFFDRAEFQRITRLCSTEELVSVERKLCGEIGQGTYESRMRILKAKLQIVRDELGWRDNGGEEL